MSQHDGDLANAGGSTFRADLNNFIAAVLTKMSGAAAPGTTYANMDWLDTTLGLLKRRNNADNAWLLIDTADGAYYEAVSAAKTLDQADINKRFVCASASAYSVSFNAAATLGPRWGCFILNNGSSGNDITLDPDGAETINGTSTLALSDGAWAFVFSTGSALMALTSKDLTKAVTEYERQQYAKEATLTDGANISWNLDTGQSAKVTLGGNRTLDNPTNLKAGAVYKLRVIQDGTGSRTLSYGTAYKFPGGTAPVLSTGASAVDVLACECDGTNMNCVINQDFA